MDQPNNAPTLIETFVRIHKVITRALSVTCERGPEFLKQGFPDANTQQGFADYVQCLVSVLAAHHLGEDDLAFPFLRKHHVVAPYGRLTANHVQIRRALTLVDYNLPNLSGAAAQTVPGTALAAVVENLERVSEIWPPHIDTEETCISGEMINTSISLVDQARLSAEMAKHSQEHTDPPFLVLPFVLFNLSGADRAGMAATMPRQVVEELILKEWRPKWAPMQPFLLE